MYTAFLKVKTVELLILQDDTLLMNSSSVKFYIYINLLRNYLLNNSKASLLKQIEEKKRKQ